MRWDEAQILSENTTEDGELTQSPLIGVVYCGYCGTMMTPAIDRRPRGTSFICERPACSHNKIRTRRLEDAVARIMRFWVANQDQFRKQALEMLRHNYGSLREETDRLKRVIERKRTALQKWTADYEESLIDREEYYAHRLRLEADLARARAVHDDNEVALGEVDAAEILASLEGLLARYHPDSLDNWDEPEIAHEVKVILRRMGLEVTVWAERKEIRLSPIRWHRLTSILEDSEAG